LGKKSSIPMMPPGPDAEPGSLDPVCGMTVQPESAAGSYVYQGRTYYFCSGGCLATFPQDPAPFLVPPAQRITTPTPAPPGSKVEYICPMDPEVVSTEPGACPICGMALEPKIIT